MNLWFIILRNSCCQPGEVTMRLGTLLPVSDRYSLGFPANGWRRPVVLKVVSDGVEITYRRELIRQGCMLFLELQTPWLVGGNFTFSNFTLRLFHPSIVVRNHIKVVLSVTNLIMVPFPNPVFKASTRPVFICTHTRFLTVSCIYLSQSHLHLSLSGQQLDNCPVGAVTMLSCLLVTYSYQAPVEGVTVVKQSVWKIGLKRSVISCSAISSALI